MQRPVRAARDRAITAILELVDVVRRGWLGYVFAIATVAVVTIFIGVIEAGAHIANISMLYLIPVLAAATLAGRGPAIVASVGAFLAFNWFFVEPKHTFTVGDPGEWFALMLFLVTAGITGQLAAMQRARAREAAESAREATLLFEVAHVLGDPAIDKAVQAVAERVCTGLRVTAVVVELEDAGATRRFTAGDSGPLSGGDSVGSMATWIPSARPMARSRARWIRVVGQHGPAPSPVVRNERVHAVPLQSGARRLGTIAILRAVGRQAGSADDRILVTVATQLVGAIDRARLSAEATNAEVLRRADDLKSALLGAVSHDLRTPLASIIASAGSLRQPDVRWTDAERESFLSDIEEEARRLSRIVNNLLDLSRMESGTLHPERGWYDLAALIDDVVGRLRPLTQEHHVTVRVAEDLPPISLDYVEIDQVLSNLLENAARHTRTGTNITVSARAEGGEVVVEVADDGPGIPPEAIDRLFEPFFRAQGQATPRGTGLGLAVARGLIDAHGGRIWARNGPSRGAVFGFTLPLEGRTAPATMAKR